jgi:hypothetical protein
MIGNLLVKRTIGENTTTLDLSHLLLSLFYTLTIDIKIVFKEKVLKIEPFYTFIQKTAVTINGFIFENSLQNIIGGG